MATLEINGQADDKHRQAAKTGKIKPLLAADLRQRAAPSANRRRYDTAPVPKSVAPHPQHR